METICMVQKAAAMDSWWQAALSRQSTSSCITSHAEILGETAHHPGDSAPLEPRFGALWLLAFPKTKITFKREEILDHGWDSGKYDGAVEGNWENCVRSQGAYFEGDWGVIVLCTVFLVSSSINLCFSYYVAGYLLDRPVIYSSEKYFLCNRSRGFFLIYCVLVVNSETLFASHDKLYSFCMVLFCFRLAKKTITDNGNWRQMIILQNPLIICLFTIFIVA